jgi:hypothetical protein
MWISRSCTLSAHPLISHTVDRLLGNVLSQNGGGSRISSFDFSFFRGVAGAPDGENTRVTATVARSWTFFTILCSLRARWMRLKMTAVATLAGGLRQLGTWAKVHPGFVLVVASFALLSPKGFFSSKVASQDSFLSLGWQVPHAFQAVGAPSSGISPSGQAYLFVPSLDVRSGPRVTGSPRVGKVCSCLRSVGVPCRQQHLQIELALAHGHGLLQQRLKRLLAVCRPIHITAPCRAHAHRLSGMSGPLVAPCRVHMCARSHRLAAVELQWF